MKEAKRRMANKIQQCQQQTLMKQITFSTFVIQEELHKKKKKVTTKGSKAGPLKLNMLTT